jgi:HPt (histidine-containing phosphotransfer) domain-containing protein
MQSQKAVLDGQQVEELRNVDGGRGEVLARLAAKFRASVPERVESMQRHAAAAALDELGATAHALKGAAASLGAARLSALCQAIEGAARQKDGASAQALTASLRAESEAACEALQNALGGTP